VDEARPRSTTTSDIPHGTNTKTTTARREETPRLPATRALRVFYHDLFPFVSGACFSFFAASAACHM
jgi:hypothetical protein